MKLTIVCSGIKSPHVGWSAIDELAYLLVHYFDAQLLSPATLTKSALHRLTRRGYPRYAKQNCAEGDVLMVVAHGPADLAMLSAIPDVRKKFKKIYAFVTDSYFHAGFPSETALFDAITVTAHEDQTFPAHQFGIEVSQLYQGTDALRWAPHRDLTRDIDVISYGRTPPSYHTSLIQHLHVAESPYLYLHSPLGHITGPDVQLERGMLFKLLHRSRISLAFHLFVEPQGDRPRSMMITSRWLESLLAGCIVAGKRPISRMADEMLFWDNATVELADEPEKAYEEILDLLHRNDDLHGQRRQNIRHIIEHHDWRYRIKTMCERFDWPTPLALTADIEQLQLLARSFK